MSVDQTTTSAARWRALRARDAERFAAGARHVVIRVGAPTVDDEAPAPDLALVDPQSPSAVRALDDLVERARTGWRFRIEGDDAGTSFVRSRLLDAGGIDEEIDVVPLSGGRPDAIRVYCGHCHVTTDAPAAEIVVCDGCALPLTVYYHFSRLRGAYLGYLGDAEER